MSELRTQSGRALTRDAVIDRLATLIRNEAYPEFRFAPAPDWARRAAAVVIDFHQPMLDGTDGAHPAWWRGCDYGYAKGRDALLDELEAAVSGLPQPTLGLAGGVNRASVLSLIQQHRETT